MNELNRALSVRLLWLIPAFLFIGIAIFSAKALFADVYLGVARQRQQSNPHSVVALSAAEMSTRLAPWKTGAWQTYADLLSSQQKYDAAVDAMNEAIIWTPLDGAKWTALAQLEGQASGWGMPYKTALTRAVVLAPNVPPVRRHVAVQGVYWWRQGDAESRQIWLDSMKASLQMDLPFFLATIVWAHREDNFCLELGEALKLKKWCDFTRFARSACLSGKPLYPEQQQYCDTYGYVDKVQANVR